MKIRTSFVSNSSSSSYIVDIHGITEQGFLKLIKQEYSWKFEYDDIKKEVYEMYDKVMNMSSQSRFHGLVNGWIAEVTNAKNKFEEIQTDEDFVRFLLEHNQIKMTLDENVNLVRLSGWTSMHNSFGDMPELLKEILLFFLIDTNYKTNCTRKSYD